MDEVYYDAVDWHSVLKKKDEDITKLRQQIVYLEKLADKLDNRVKMLKKDLSASDRKYQDLEEKYIRSRKRLQWLEKKEAEQRYEERRKKLKFKESKR